MDSTNLQTIQYMETNMAIKDRKIFLLEAELKRMCELYSELQIELEILKGKVATANRGSMRKSQIFPE